MKRKVLIAASSMAVCRDWFPASLYEKPVWETSAAGAKRRLAEESFDYAIVISPLKDEAALQCACSLAGLFKISVLLFVGNEILDQALWQCRDLPVFVLGLPANKFVALQCMAMLEKFGDGQRELERQIQKQKQKLEEEKLVGRCKLKLIEQYRWPESRAHSFILQAAMDNHTTKGAVAKALLLKMQEKEVTS